MVRSLRLSSPLVARTVVVSSLLAAVALVLGGCSGGSAPALPSPDIEGDVIVRKDVVVIPADGSVDMVSVSDDTIRISGVVPPLAPGDVIVSGMGNGVLRRCTGVSADAGGLLLTTEGATFEDLFEQAHFSYHVEPTEYESITPGPGVTIEGVNDAAGGGVVSPAAHFNLTKIALSAKFNIIPQVAVSAATTSKPAIDIEMDIKQHKLRYFMAKIVLDNSLNVGVELKATLKKWQISHKHYLWGTTLTPIVFFVGIVPVVIVPEFTLHMGVNASLSADLTLGVSREWGAKVGAGVVYTEQTGKWDGLPIYEPRPGSTRITVGGKIIGVLDLNPVILKGALKLYSVLGPYVAGSLGVGTSWSFGATYKPFDGVSAVKVTGDLYGVAEVKPGVEIAVLSESLANWEAPFSFRFQRGLRGFPRDYEVYEDGAVPIVVD